MQKLLYSLVLLVAGCGEGPTTIPTAQFDVTRIYYSADAVLGSETAPVYVVGLADAITEAAATLEGQNTQSGEAVEFVEGSSGGFVARVDASRDDIVELRLSTQSDSATVESVAELPLADNLGGSGNPSCRRALLANRWGR